MKKCIFGVSDYLVCQRPMSRCPFSMDCAGEITEASVAVLREKAEAKFLELKIARKEFHSAVKLFAQAEERLTSKEFQQHLTDVPKPRWWHFFNFKPTK